jgi:hypothetical protein
MSGKMGDSAMQVESILNPVRGIRDAQARAGITPTNHSRHNILAVKEQSRINALQKQQQAETIAAQQPFTPQLYRSASSSSGGAAAAAAQRAQKFGRSSSASSSSGKFASSSGVLRSISGDEAMAAPIRNFVQENKAAAAASSRPVKAESRVDEGAAYLQKSEYGQVPAYLLGRKLQLAQEQEALLAAKQAAQIPAGSQTMCNALPADAEALSSLSGMSRTPRSQCLISASCHCHLSVGGCLVVVYCTTNADCCVQDYCVPE